MTSIFIIYEMIEDVSKNDLSEITNENFQLFCKIFPNNYMVFHFLMMISFILRCHRIIECCKIKYDERTEIKEFYERRYIFQENYYLKILFACIIVIMFLNFLLNFETGSFVIIPYHFTKCMADVRKGQYFVSILWVVINFMEGVVLVTYTYFISINQIRQMIKCELFGFLAVWIIYPNVLRISDFAFNADLLSNESHWTSYVCCFFLYICLFINGYLPVISSYLDKTNTSYHFNPKLIQNFYLFLSNELCYYSFYEYLSSHSNDKDKFYIDFYTDMVKYKFKYTLEPDYYKVLEDANDIYNNYFSDPAIDRYIDIDIANKIKNACQMLSKEECTYEMFDEALVFCYVYLEKRFYDYKRSADYQILIDNLNLNSYIQCKMCNTGLINKY
jgi:hypothetical protein